MAGKVANSRDGTIEETGLWVSVVLGLPQAKPCKVFLILGLPDVSV